MATVMEITTTELDHKTVTVEQMLRYLQEMMDQFKKEEKQFGKDERLTRHLDGMIACKEMVEALIEYPVNLQKDGKVTVGF